MPKKYSNAKYIVIFVLVQLAWLAVLGLWIARYVSNNMVLKEIDQRYAINISTGGNIAVLVVGLALITAATAGMWILFRYLNFHFHQTRLYDNFISSITHELKTPLASIQLYIETLISYEDISGNQVRSFVEKMHSEIVRLNKMINSILEVGRLENRNAIYNCRIMNANATLKAIWEDLRVQYNLEKSQFQTDGNTQSQVVLDQTAIRLVFENLIDNSLKYSPDNPRIEIQVSESDKYIQIRYRDYGNGISHQQLKKIFKKFYRITDMQNPSVRGTGLGLYLVKGIINFHGGNITADIPIDNIGLLFDIEFPRYPLHRKSYLNKLLKSKY
ncbi:MAG: HAMP domain-containing sensor histidine kinase [Candidatus Marinimicrobia bacterium]|nr:HAMP domain-containing sensor histidine kinase [Candidatus Neomarinimicrobiota bacterium]